MIGEGMKVRFVPYDLESEKLTDEDRLEATRIAKVVYINWEHRYFTTEWSANGAKRRESFKFSEIGKKVFICGQ